MSPIPLHDQLAAIERELSELDFDGAHERIRLAEAELARLGGAKPQESASRPISPPGNALTDEQLRAGGQVKQARTALARLDARAADLRRKADGIGRLLNAGDRVEQAQADVQRAQQAADISAADLADAKATCARLDSAITAEKRMAAAAVDASAAAMLEAARTGADAGAVPVRPDRLVPLQAALTGAEAERDRISTRHEADLAAVTSAQRLVREAEADVSQGEYEAAEAAFIALAAQHVIALTRSGRHAPALMDLHGKVLAAAQSLEAAS